MENIMQLVPVLAVWGVLFAPCFAVVLATIKWGEAERGRGY